MRFLFLLALSMNVHAEILKAEIDTLQVSANFERVEDNSKDQPVFLVLHGTWAHYGMEIIEAIQMGLAERGYSSLAPTLSLGESNRVGFRDCSAPFLMRHEDAVRELDLWVRYLSGEGYTNVVVVGHSRGASQVALFLASQAQVIAQIQNVVLIAPMVFRDPVSPLPQDQLLHCRGVVVQKEILQSYYSAIPVKHTPALVEKLTLPALIILGSEDEIAVWNDDDRKRVATRDIHRIVDIDGADHFFRDLYLEDVLDVVVADP